MHADRTKDYLASSIRVGTYLLVLDFTRDDHLAVQVSRTGGNHRHLDLAIIDEEVVANLTRLDDFGMGQQDALVGAGSFVQIEPKGLTFLQHLSVGVGEGSDAELGTLQISQDGNGVVVLFLDLTDDVEQFLLLVVLAVGEVETENVGASEEELLDHLERRRGGAEGGQLLGLLAPTLAVLEVVRYQLRRGSGDGVEVGILQGSADVGVESKVGEGHGRARQRCEKVDASDPHFTSKTEQVNRTRGLESEMGERLFLRCLR